MTRKSIVLLAASHTVVIMLGVLIARQPAAAGNKPAAAAGPGRSAQAGPAAPGQTRSGKSATFRPSTEWRGSEYAKAWKAVKTAKLTTKERIKAQRELLKQWAEVDLTSAIQAALGEAWDGDQRRVFGGGTGPLMDVFADALAKNPQEGWDIIQGRQFGVASGILRSVWIRAVGAKDPMFLAERIGELSWRDRQDAVDACQLAVGSPGGVTKADLFKVLARLPEDVVTTEQLVLFAAPPEGAAADPAAMKAEILRLGSGDERLAKAKAMFLGSLLSAKSSVEIEAEIQSLPMGLGQEVLWSAFKAGRNPEDVMGTMDLLIDRNAWDKVGQRDAEHQIQRISRNGGAEAVAEWALTLPVRKETMELFHRGVDTYMRENMESARAWVSAIEPGVWRDWAFAEYSQQALNAHNDPAASRWALDQIADKAMKDEASGWRSQWEARTGWKKK